MAKHFLKVLTIFLVMIILGLVGVFAVDYLSRGADKSIDANGPMEVAE